MEQTIKLLLKYQRLQPVPSRTMKKNSHLLT